MATMKWQSEVRSIYNNQYLSRTTVVANDTSPGIDNILNLVLKIPELEGEVTDMLSHHSKDLNFGNTIPDDWRQSVIVSMPKKGNSTALDNQRGIFSTKSFLTVCSSVNANVVFVLAGQPPNRWWHSDALWIPAESRTWLYHLSLLTFKRYLTLSTDHRSRLFSASTMCQTVLSVILPRCTMILLSVSWWN